MAWVKFEDFSNADQWPKESEAHLWYSVNTTDWPEYMSSRGKQEQVRIDFNGFDFVPSYIEKIYPDPVYFNYLDKLGKFFTYDSLVLIYEFVPGPTIEPIAYRTPNDFYFSFAIYDENELLREWFIPARASTCGYEREMFDLLPLVQAGKTKFTRSRLSFHRHPGAGAKFYLGDAYVFQDSIVHNVSVGIASLLHLRPRKFLTTVREMASTGQDFLVLNSAVDIHSGTPIIIGNPDSDLWEYHIVAEGPEETFGTTVRFGGGFDGEKLLFSWPPETPVYFAPAAIFGDVRESESPFPSYYIAVDAPEPEEPMTPMVGYKKVCYVRDPSGEEHTVAVSLSRDTLRVPVEIYVYGNNPEEAEDMWKELRRVFNSQSQIEICGVSHDYEIITTRNPVLEEYDNLPQYIMELIVYAEQDVHDREYLKFPLIKRLTIGNTSGTSVEGLVPVEIDLQFGD